MHMSSNSFKTSFKFIRLLVHRIASKGKISRSAGFVLHYRDSLTKIALSWQLPSADDLCQVLIKSRRRA